MLLHQAFPSFLELLVAYNSAVTSLESTMLAAVHETAAESVEPVDQPVAKVVEFELFPLLQLLLENLFSLSGAGLQ